VRGGRSSRDQGLSTAGDLVSAPGNESTRGDVAADLLLRAMSRAADGNTGSAMRRRKQTRPRVSVVVPALNEEANLPYVLPMIGLWVDEVILVDGYSTDRTTQVARTLLPGIRIVHQQGSGKGAALRSGFAAASGDIIVMLDADGSTDPREIPAFVGALAAGADFVKGTRFAQGAGSADMSLLRMLGNRGLVLAVRLLFGGRFSDLCYGYIAFWRRILPQLDLDSDGFAIETQMSVRALATGLKVAEVPSFEFRRLHGKSNLRTIPDGWGVLKTILRERISRSTG
jgi:glycosyltransferase involved in cell wall biosynthesis